MCNIIDPKLNTGEYAKYFKKLNATTEENTSSDNNRSMATFAGSSATIPETQNGQIYNGPKEDGSEEINIPVPWGFISGKSYGDPDGYPVLAVHGWMDNSGTFDRLIPLLSKSLHIVSVDLPGHGLSSHLPKGIPYHYTDFIIALRRIVSHLKWTKFGWIGHSMGAGLGALYASTFPSHVEHLVMLDLAKPITGESGTDYATKISLAIDQFLALEQKITPDPPTYTYDDAVQRLITATANSLTHEAARTLMIRGAKESTEEKGKWYFTRDLRLRSPSILRFSHEQCFTILKHMRSNTLVIKATEAPWFEPEEICQTALDIYKENCKSFKFVEVEGNHFVHLNEPEKLSEIINEFIKIEENPEQNQPGSPNHAVVANGVISKSNL